MAPSSHEAVRVEQRRTRLVDRAGAAVFGTASSGARPGRHWREHLTGTAVLVGAGHAFRLVERPAGTAPPPPASAVAPAARPQPEQRAAPGRAGGWRGQGRSLPTSFSGRVSWNGVD
jgi:hypothetical protein